MKFWQKWGQTDCWILRQYKFLKKCQWRSLIIYSVNGNIPSGIIQAFLTTIFPCVNVPVLSEQILVTAPRASKESSFRTITFRLTIIFVPTAMVMVRTTTKLAGIIDRPVLFSEAVN